MAINDFLQTNKILGLFTKQVTSETNVKSNVVQQDLIDQYLAGFDAGNGEFALQSKSNPDMYTFIPKGTTSMEFNPYFGLGSNNTQINAVTKELTGSFEDYKALSGVLGIPISQIAINPPPALSNYENMPIPDAPQFISLGQTMGDQVLLNAQEELKNSTYFKGL